MGSIYHLILIVVAAVAVFVGFRKGLVRQLAGLLGIAFGVVAAHLLQDSVEPLIREYFPSLQGSFLEDYAYGVLTPCLIFLAVYAIMLLLSFLLKNLLNMLSLGVLNSILGALFCIFKYMLVMSVLFNVIISIDSESSLADCCNADDGNIVGAVMSLAPAMLGTQSPDDLNHLKQKEEAKTISYNNHAFSGVEPYNLNIKSIKTT